MIEGPKALNRGTNFFYSIHIQNMQFDVLALVRLFVITFWPFLDTIKERCDDEKDYNEMR